MTVRARVQGDTPRSSSRLKNGALVLQSSTLLTTSGSKFKRKKCIAQYSKFSDQQTNDNGENMGQPFEIVERVCHVSENAFRTCVEAWAFLSGRNNTWETEINGAMRAVK